MADNENNEVMASVDKTQPITPGNRDTTIDIMSLLKGTDSSTEEKKEEPKKKSALQMAKEQKQNAEKGLVVSNEELAAKEARGPVGNKTEVDAMNEIDSYMKEQEDMIDAASKIVIENKPKTALEMANLMNNLENVAKTGNVEVEVTDKHSERFSKAANQEETKVIRLKTDEELAQNSRKAFVEGEDNSEEEAPVEVDEEKKNIITVLIDKTGLGGDFAFTEEEREKLFMSTEIHLKEIEDIDLSTIVVKKADKSFVEEAQEYQFSSSQTNIAFPASRFRADMAGLTYGEMGDVGINNENLTFEQIRKRLTVIYNKMRNPSCGNFANFDDFLKKFAYVDLDLAVFGLVLSTFPDIDDIPLNCQNPKCKKSFNHKFAPKNLLKFENCDKKFLEDLKLVVTAHADELPTLVDNSPARNYKVIRLPLSGFIIKLGIASAYDYLYKIVDNVIGTKFTDNHPDDVNGVLQINSVLLSLIRAVMVPLPDGTYKEYDEFEDMIQALYRIKPDEIKILTSILQKYNNIYTVPFELTDIICPHCGAKTRRLSIDINYLVFMKYQRIMSEQIDVSNISLL